MAADPEAVAALAAYVSVDKTNTYVGECAAEAEAIVAKALHLEDGTERSTPPELRRRAVIEVGAELYARRGLRNGIATFGQADGGLQPVRVARDPMHLAREILAPYLGGPFA